MAKPKPSIKVPVETTYEDPPAEVPPGEAPDPSVAETEPPAPELPVALAPAPDVPGPQWFRVTKGGRVFVDGAVAQLVEGSCVSEVTHNLAALRAAGIQLAESAGPAQRRDAYGEVVS